MPVRDQRKGGAPRLYGERLALDAIGSDASAISPCRR
ncbi:hypothetical protein HNR07_005098 [Nocardiopsis metallicus]|uniref:Uncharacterized protein n=1 Tax=Nocardiopsis metallicus TaxID=179819 RepID=A0A840WLT8_9ACTN|nr:hypothetical protein [Nocardiopsis metallicus]